MAKTPKTKTDRDKQLLLWSAVTFFIVLIFALWLINLPSLLGSSTIDEGESDHSFNWHNISDRFSQTWSDLKQEVEKGKDSLPDEYSPDIFSSSTSTPVTASSTGQQQFEQLKEDLQDLEASLNTKRNNCPEWINCMPRIGEPVICDISPGCEGITQIAY